MKRDQKKQIINIISFDQETGFMIHIVRLKAVLDTNVYLPVAIPD
jgi:hypothetical protein